MTSLPAAALSQAGLLLAAVLLAAATSDPGFARNQIEGGIQVDQLSAMSGAGADPGAGDPEGRLRWAIATGIPAAWSQAVPVQWSIGENGHLALSFPDGRVEVSRDVLARSPESLLATVAHEMGHQIAVALAPGGDGSPPRGFVELIAGNPYTRFDEGWADCVSRVWTGSEQHTTSEPKPCPVEAARFVAGLLTDPENFKEPPPGVPSPLEQAVDPSPPAQEPKREPSDEDPAQSGGPLFLMVGALTAVVVLRVRRRGKKAED